MHEMMGKPAHKSNEKNIWSEKKVQKKTTNNIRWRLAIE